MGTPEETPWAQGDPEKDPGGGITPHLLPLLLLLALGGFAVGVGGSRFLLFGRFDLLLPLFLLLLLQDAQVILCTPLHLNHR